MRKLLASFVLICCCESVAAANDIGKFFLDVSGYSDASDDAKRKAQELVADLNALLATADGVLGKRMGELEGNVDRLFKLRAETFSDLQSLLSELDRILKDLRIDFANAVKEVECSSEVLIERLSTEAGRKTWFLGNSLRGVHLPITDSDVVLRDSQYQEFDSIYDSTISYLEADLSEASGDTPRTAIAEALTQLTTKAKRALCITKSDEARRRYVHDVTKYAAAERNWGYFNE